MSDLGEWIDKTKIYLCSFKRRGINPFIEYPVSNVYGDMEHGKIAEQFYYNKRISERRKTGEQRGDHGRI